MAYATKLVLHCRSGVPEGLPALVEAFIAGGVRYIGVVGKDAALVEEVIDECIVGDGSGDPREILTASHQNESLEYGVEFARSLTGLYEGEVQVVEV